MPFNLFTSLSKSYITIITHTLKINNNSLDYMISLRIQDQTPHIISGYVKVQFPFLIIIIIAYNYWPMTRCQALD